MGKIIDLTGQKFGRWSVIKRAEKPVGQTSTSAFWLCECECGEKRIVSGNVLRQGKSKSCGCLNKDFRAEDISGKRFGNLIVIKRVKTPEGIKGGEAYWLCKCDCGKEKIIAGKSLRKGKTITCGCHCDKITDLTGKKFGKLTVIGHDFDGEKGNGSRWLCECECGNIISSLGSNLIVGNIKSCGCLVSQGENEIKRILEENNILFKTQYTFSDLNSVAGYPLRFDFAIFENNNLKLLVEFQGEQHYENSGSAFFDKTVLINDLLKKDYCEKKLIKLNCIPYWKRNRLTIEDILGSEES